LYAWCSLFYTAGFVQHSFVACDDAVQNRHYSSTDSSLRLIFNNERLTGTRKFNVAAIALLTGAKLLATQHKSSN